MEYSVNLANQILLAKEGLRQIKYTELFTFPLFLKDKSFSHQSECRIVVNTADTSIINMLVGKPIEIGSLKEIAVKADDYLDQGAIVKATATIYNIDE